MLVRDPGQGNYRSIRYVRPLCPATVVHGGREYLNLCSNSYLSLPPPAVMAAARSAVDEYGRHLFVAERIGEH
jgi:7-keto-8-aminopelargonate synthetase-like enzyme